MYSTNAIFVPLIPLANSQLDHNLLWHLGAQGYCPQSVYIYKYFCTLSNPGPGATVGNFCGFEDDGITSHSTY